MEDDFFSLTFLKKIKEVMQAFKENWECTQALHTLISLTARVLSLTSSQKIQKICLSHLKAMQNIAYSWVNILKQKVDESIDDRHRQELLGKAVLVALICVGSFDVDQHHLRSILARSMRFVSVRYTREDAMRCLMGYEFSFFLCVLYEYEYCRHMAPFTPITARSRVEFDCHCALDQG
jgi:hypothetical protein